MDHLFESYKLALGKPMPAVPSGFGWLILRMNKATQELYFLPPPFFRGNSPDRNTEMSIVKRSTELDCWMNIPLGTRNGS
jgi:hypothetical protein